MGYFDKNEQELDRGDHVTGCDILHRVSKNVAPLACCIFDTHERILIFFGRNVTDKVANSWDDRSLRSENSNGYQSRLKADLE